MDTAISEDVHAVRSARINGPVRLIVVGFDEIVVNKYLGCVGDAIAQGYIESYSIIDLESQRQEIESRVAGAGVKPRMTVYLPDRLALDPRSQAAAIDSAIRRVTDPAVPTKVYIATEVRSHAAYLRYCIDKGISALVEKPVLAPLEGDRFDPGSITPLMGSLIKTANETAATFSVMTLSRYHEIYNRGVIGALRQRMQRWGTPLTSLHLRVGGGVWNTQTEFESRNDHPYRYGYGMLMHGAYHYVDLATQILALNALVFPDQKFTLDLVSFAAFPVDQHQRITGEAARLMGDEGQRIQQDRQGRLRYGETDVVATFRLFEADTDRTITIGTMSFEQTTPSIRDWPVIPAGIYNKNGRTSSVDVEAQLSTLYSHKVHCYDVPRGEGVDAIDACAQVTERANACLDPGEEYVKVTTFDGLFHSNSNRELMEHWLRGTETSSRLASHFLSMKVTQALAMSVRQPGVAVRITDFDTADLVAGLQGRQLQDLRS